MGRGRLSPWLWPTLREQRETRELMGWDWPVRLDPVDEWAGWDVCYGRRALASEPEPEPEPIIITPDPARRKVNKRAFRGHREIVGTPREVARTFRRDAELVLAGAILLNIATRAPYWAQLFGRLYGDGWWGASWWRDARSSPWCQSCGRYCERGAGACHVCGWRMP
jgi:hypothetical protein